MSNWFKTTLSFILTFNKQLMTQLNTPLDIFKFIVNTQQIDEIHEAPFTSLYICNIIYNLFDKDIISETLANEIIEILKNNKPTKTNKFKKYTKHPSWIKDIINSSAWWKMDYFNKQIVISLKYDYLNDLIKHLENEQS